MSSPNHHAVIMDSENLHMADDKTADALIRIEHYHKVKHDLSRQVRELSRENDNLKAKDAIVEKKMQQMIAEMAALKASQSSSNIEAAINEKVVENEQLRMELDAKQQEVESLKSAMDEMQRNSSQESGNQKNSNQESGNQKNLNQENGNQESGNQKNGNQENENHSGQDDLPSMQIRMRLDQIIKTALTEVAGWRDLLARLNIKPKDPMDGPNEVLSLIGQLRCKLGMAESRLMEEKMSSDCRDSSQATLQRSINDLQASVQTLHSLNSNLQAEKEDLLAKMAQLKEANANHSCPTRSETIQPESNSQLESLLKQTRQELETTKDALLIAKHAAQIEREDASALRSLYDQFQLAGVDRCIEKIKQVLLESQQGIKVPTDDQLIKTLTELCNSQDIAASKLESIYLTDTSPSKQELFKSIIKLIEDLQQCKARLNQLSLKFDTFVATKTSKSSLVDQKGIHKNRTYEGFDTPEDEVETLENIIFEQESRINQLVEQCELLAKRNVDLANLNLK